MLPAAWAALAAYASPPERAVIDKLGASGGAVPEMGIEAAGGIPISFAWSTVKAAIALDLEDGEADAVRAAGWTLIDPESDDLVAEVATLTGGQ